MKQLHAVRGMLSLLALLCQIAGTALVAAGHYRTAVAVLCVAILVLWIRIQFGSER